MSERENYDERNRPHIKIDAFCERVAYTFPSKKQERKPLRDDYAAHAEHLIRQLMHALDAQPAVDVDPTWDMQGLKHGTIVEIETLSPAEASAAKTTKIPTKLEFPTQDIVILRTERNDDRTESALLFIPDDARNFLRLRIENYGRDPGNQRRPDIDRFEVIEAVRATDITALFINGVDLADSSVFWWELWVRQSAADQLIMIAKNSKIDVHEDKLLFPDTTVIFLHTNAKTIAAFAARTAGTIMEIRKAVGTIEIFLDNKCENQQDWVEDLTARVIVPPKEGPVICTLDTGVAAGHPLIAKGLRGAWSYNAAWGSDDHCPHGGHGTPLAGLVLYGDLEPLMNGTQPILLTHGVESMKLLPPNGFPPTKPPSYGVVTQGAVSKVEIEQPNVLRSFCLAVSTTDFSASMPSTWSGALDQIAAGAMPGEVTDKIEPFNRPKRLMVVATGNILGGRKEDLLKSKPLEDPSQSWNALTVGGITRKEQSPMLPPELSPVVPANHLSPFSRGSRSLPNDLTPIKPEVLFEAGNMLSDATGFCGWNAAVSLLAPGSDVVTEPLVPFWATSAAAGLAGHFVGKLQAALPDVWPETHRALIVNSANWPDPIRKQFIGRGAHWKTGKNATKAKVQQMLREVGYGVPDITQAIMSARNDATMIAQAEIQPYAIGSNGNSVFNEMHVYDLPWPKTALEQIDNEIVTMKVTLSYFIEPNISGKAATRPETYRSFGLRFAMKKRNETNARFRNRISASQKKDGTESDNEQSYWLLGPKAIQAGSLHCDIWRGYAADLALHDAIAVYPVSGWWKSHTGQKRITDTARYALIISISAPGQDIDLYSEIETLVEAKEIETLIG